MMYSRIPRRPPVQKPVGMPSYRQSVTPPPNYSGNVFSNDTVFPDSTDLPRDPLGEARPRFDDLPAVSGLATRRGDLPPEPSSLSDISNETTPPTNPPVAVAQPDPTALRAVGPSLLDRSHFPLGHGLGQEEILILGLMLLLLYEDRSSSDGEENDLFLTLLLLGALLFCG